MSSPATSSAFTRHLLHQYDLVHGMLGRLAEDFSEEEATRPAGDMKPLVWYLGHVAITDNYLLMLYGGETAAISEEHIKRFGRGSDGHADFSDASKAQMVELLATLSGRVHALVSTLEPDDLDRETTEKTAHPVFKTLGGAFSLVIAHCAYHGGQVGDLRRALGKDALFG